MVGWLCCVDRIVPRLFITQLLSSLWSLTWHISYVDLHLFLQQVLYFKLVSSVLVFCCCHFNIHLTEVGAMHEAVYIYSILSTKHHFLFGYFTSVRFIMWEDCLMAARVCHTLPIMLFEKCKDTYWECWE